MFRFRFSHHPTPKFRLSAYLLTPFLLLLLMGAIVWSMALPVLATRGNNDDLFTGFSAPLVTLSFAGGSGTQADPYLVATAEQLSNVRDHLDAYFRQTAEIDLGVAPWNGGDGWVPIGTTATPFTGSFDGGGHTIRNLAINRPNSSHQGLFGTVSEAQLFNLHLQDVNLRTRSHSGALAGVIGFDSLIEKLTVTGAINGAPGQDVGGLAGVMNLSILHRVSVTATVQGGAATGGLFGVINGGEIRHSHSAGSVQGTQQVGGLVGYVGAINTSIISDSYSRAAVSSGGSAGGLFGYLYGGIVERSYSAGPVNGTGDNVGGFIGQGAGTSVSDCYWDTQTSGQLTSAGGDGVMGRTTAQMQQQATYPRFNFAALWTMDEGSGYPVFQDLDMYAQPQPVDLADLTGSGTMQDPYLITNIHELNAVRQNLAASYWLTTDMDLADTVVWDYGRGWSPIGTTATPFTGSFDGGGHTLRNLAINRPNSSHQGLFGTVSEAQFFNLHLQDVNLQTRSHSGALAGEIRLNSWIEKLTVTGAINGAPGQDVGGLAGAMTLSTLHRVAVTATVQGGAATGGLFGVINGGEIRHSHSAGSVQGTQQVGGLVGYVSINTPIISDSYSRAAVSSGDSAGGLIGHLLSGIVERSYSAGPVNGTGANVGGFIGQGAGTSVFDCYWDTQTSGQNSSAGGDGVVGRTTAQMTYPYAANTYVEWNFQTIWAADEEGTRNGGYPYLEPRGADQSDVQVYILGSNRISPGQVVDYAVEYAHYLTEPLQDALLIVRLPYLATYQSSTPQGTYWPQRHELFWELGDLPSGTNARAMVSVEYGWGIPRDAEDNLAAVLVGQNYQAELLDRTEYQTYTPLAATATQPLTQAQWEAEAGANPNLNTLYTQAINDGYTWASSQRVTLNNGTIHAQATLLHLQSRAVRILQMEGANAQAVTHATNFYSAEDVNGGMSWDMLTNEKRYWGDWDASVGAAWPGSCDGAGCCLSNCLAKVAVNAVAGKFGTAMNAALTGYGCATAFRTQDPSAMAQCAASIQEELVEVNGVPILGELAGITECLALCAGDPNSNDCTKDLVTCEPSWSNLYDWLDYPSKTVWRCKDGCFSSVPEYVPCAYGQCCMPGVGCVSGDACKRNVNDPPRDPNEKYGPAGELIPGQRVDYLIEYENVGAGAAEGVYITDYLDDLFDATTLQIGPNASYYPSVRLLTWDIGHLDPAGQPGATGQVTLTVGLKDGVPGGTIVTNQATVYFPTVPEETPTGTVVNLVQPAMAIPQQLTTDYMTALPVSLSGRDVSGLPLTYEIVQQPFGGLLIGNPPNLTYTPHENFTGPDSFSFTVDNGTSTSRATQVRIEVSTAGDTTAPTLLWSSPEADATGVAFSAGAVFTDTTGPVFAPVIRVGVSEPLDETTVTTATVGLADSSRVALPITVVYDGGLNQIVTTPRQALAAGRSYTLTVSTGVTDRAGNHLAAPVPVGFTTETDEQRLFLPAISR